MKPTYVVALTGPFAGQTGRVVTTHTYQEIGLHYSVRFPTGGVWIAAGEVRPANEAEATRARSKPLRPAA